VDGGRLWIHEKQLSKKAAGLDAHVCPRDLEDAHVPAPTCQREKPTLTSSSHELLGHGDSYAEFNQEVSSGQTSSVSG